MNFVRSVCVREMWATSSSGCWKRELCREMLHCNLVARLLLIADSNLNLGLFSHPLNQLELTQFFFFVRCSSFSIEDWFFSTFRITCRHFDCTNQYITLNGRHTCDCREFQISIHRVNHLSPSVSPRCFFIFFFVSCSSRKDDGELLIN